MVDNIKIAEQYQELFNLLNKEHGLIPTESEMDEIIRVSILLVYKYNSDMADSIEKEFIEWYTNGNVICLTDNTYTTHDAQWKNRIPNFIELKKYFIKEILNL